jgi:hypothetical protein
MEKGRIHVTTKQSAEFSASIIVRANGIPVHFIMNLEGMSEQDLRDRKQLIHPLPTRVEEESIYFAIPRSVERIRLIA